MTLDEMDLDTLCVNTIRTLSIDMVTQANSGHPGAPLGAAAIAYALFARFLKYDPSRPDWPDRDRFVLSAGHASALLYAVLHLSGYDLPMDELKRFRQLGSMTPGHPEADCAPGVEVSTGPLGQGIGNALGMAMAERYLAARFNRPGHEIVDHCTYALASDGDMMEGVSHEAASLAGHLKLGRLIVLYDDNKISLEGPTAEWFTEDVEARFRAYGWQTIRVEDATTNVDAIAAAVEEARRNTEQPSLILCCTHIGYASPLQDSHKAHGAPLTPDQVKATKRALGWPEESSFLVPERVRARFAESAARGAALRKDWETRFEHYAAAHPKEAVMWRTAWSGGLPEGWDAGLPAFDPREGQATRSAAGKALDVIRKNCPMLIGGCADLGSSTGTLPKDTASMAPADYGRHYVRFGVREHAMAAACNGIVRHGGLRAFGSTFLVFADYARPSLRLAGLMETPVIYQFTHDSIGVGEDGPTHQPVEQMLTLRAIPTWTVIRPADANEAVEAWRAAMLNATGPTALICSRQKLPVFPRTAACTAEMLHKGAYVLREAEGGRPDVVLMASGSEVSRCMAAADKLAAAGVSARVVSFPSWEIFEKQPDEYRRSVLPPDLPKLAVEAGSPIGWERYTGARGEVIGLARFGESGPGEEVLDSLGFAVEHIVQRALRLVGR